MKIEEYFSPYHNPNDGSYLDQIFREQQLVMQRKKSFNKLIKLPNGHKWPMMIYMLRFGSLEQLEYFLQHGVNPSEKILNGKLLIEYAYKFSNKDKTILMLQYGHEDLIGVYGMRLFQSAISGADISTAEKLLSNWPGLLKSISQPIREALDSHHYPKYKMVELFLSAGAKLEDEPTLLSDIIRTTSDKGFYDVVNLGVPINSQHIAELMDTMDSWLSKKETVLKHIEYLLRCGVDPNGLPDDREPLLFKALELDRRGKMAPVIDLLLKYGANIHVKNKNGETSLLKASRWASFISFKKLMKYGSSINIADNEGNTVLTNIILYNYSDSFYPIVKQLVERGNSLLRVDHKRIGKALINYQNVDLLMLFEGKISFSEELLLLGFSLQSIELVEMFLKQEGTISNTISNKTIEIGFATKSLGIIKLLWLYKVPLSESQKETLFLQALSSQDAKFVHKLLKSSDKELYCSKKIKAYNIALENQDEKTCYVLVYNQLKPRKNHIVNMFHLAVHTGFLELVQLLWNSFSEMALSQDEAGNSLLHIAAINGHLSIVDFLIDKMDVNIRNNLGESLLHVLISRNTDVTMIRKHLKLMNLDHIDNAGHTALLMASSKNNEEHVLLLLEEGADPNLGLLEGLTPLLTASENNNSEIVRLLLEYGADPNMESLEGLTPLLTASENNNPEIVRLLLEYGADPNLESLEGLTPLLTAGGKNNPMIVRLLLEYGANPNASDNKGEFPLVTSSFEVKKLLLSYNADQGLWKDYYTEQTLLMKAIRTGDLKLPMLLLDFPLDPNLKDREGNTALHYAYRTSNSQVIEKLLLKGADPEIRNRDNILPRYINKIYRNF